MDSTLKNFVSLYGQDKWLDVSSLVPWQENMWGNEHIKSMRPILWQMTEWEFLNFVAEMIAEYNTISLEELSEQTAEPLPQEQLPMDLQAPVMPQENLPIM